MDKVHKVMKEYKEGDLHSGSKHGPKVKSRKQAVAIALSEQREQEKKAEENIYLAKIASAYQDEKKKDKHTAVGAVGGAASGAAAGALAHDYIHLPSVRYRSWDTRPKVGHKYLATGAAIGALVGGVAARHRAKLQILKRDEHKKEAEVKTASKLKDALDIGKNILKGNKEGLIADRRVQGAMGVAGGAGYIIGNKRGNKKGYTEGATHGGAAGLMLHDRTMANPGKTFSIKLPKHGVNLKARKRLPTDPPGNSLVKAAENVYLSKLAEMIEQDAKQIKAKVDEKFFTRTKLRGC